MRKDWAVARERAANILRHFDAGMGISEIAQLYNLSYMRVHQICTAPPRHKMRQKPQNGVGIKADENKRSSRK